MEGLRARQLGRNGQGVTLSAWQLLPVVGCLQRGSAARPGAAEDAAGGRVQVKDQREHRLAGDVVKLDLAAAQVLSGAERVDLAPFGAPLRAGGVVVRVLHVDPAPSLAGEDVRLAAAEPDVTPRPRRLWGDLVILEAKRVETLEALSLVNLSKEKHMCCLTLKKKKMNFIMHLGYFGGN